VKNNTEKHGESRSEAMASQDVHPALGNTWAHCVNIRLRLSSTANVNSNADSDGATTHTSGTTNDITERFIRVVKSPLSGSGSFRFRITEAGVCAPPDNERGEIVGHGDGQEGERNGSIAKKRKLVMTTNGTDDTRQPSSGAQVQDTQAFLMSLGADQINDVLA
jgi:hypothetical protein